MSISGDAGYVSYLSYGATVTPTPNTASIDANWVCDCQAGTTTVTLTLTGDVDDPITFVITNPYTLESVQVVVPPGEQTIQVVNLPVADVWTISTQIQWVNHDVYINGCCFNCLGEASFLATIGPAGHIIVKNPNGVNPVYHYGEPDSIVEVVWPGLGPGWWTFHVVNPPEGDFSGDEYDVEVYVESLCGEGPLDIQGLVPCRPNTTLGDGSDLRVLLMTRGGGAVIAELDPTTGNFTRELDTTSTLTMDGVITGRLADTCCDGWEEIRPWATEVIVFRDGRDVWCGPVTDARFDYGHVTIEADDLTAWWTRRVLPTLNYVNADLADIFLGVHEAAMASDPTPNIVIDVERTGLIGARSVQGSQYVYASDVLVELAKTSLDYTCYGRTVLVRGNELDTNPFLVLMDDHWTQPPSVRHRGNDQATQVVVRGDGVQSVATASAEYLDYYGLLVRTFDETAIKDQVSCDRAAGSRLELLKDALYIETPTGAKLRNTAPITLPQLIPGMRVRVDTQATCRKIIGDFRLQKVTVDFNGDVSIDLQPIGTVDALVQAEEAFGGRIPDDGHVSA